MLLFQFAVQDFLAGVAIDDIKSTGVPEEDLGCLTQAAHELVWAFQSGHSQSYCFAYVWTPVATALPVVNWISLVLVFSIWLIPVTSFIREFGVWTSKVNTGQYLQCMFRVRQEVAYRRLCFLLEGFALVITVCLLVLAGSVGVLVWVIQTKLIGGLVVVASMRAFTRPTHPTFDFASESFASLYFRGALPLPSQALAYTIAFALVEAEVTDQNQYPKPSGFFGLI